MNKYINIGQRRFYAVFIITLVTLFAFPVFVLADNVQNDVGSTGDNTITLGQSTNISYRITANNGDGQNGCNAADTTPATVTIHTPAGVTASPSSLSFSACGVFQPSTFSASAVGNYIITVTVSDSGVGTYNTSPATFTLFVSAPPDSTPPVITPNVVGTLGNNGWYRSDVTLSWTVSDPESAVSSSSGCSTTVINSDTGGTTFTCSATSTGGTSSQSVTIKRDATAPTISGSASPAPNSNGWNNSDVTVSFSCADALSGVASCGPNQTLSGEGAGQSAGGAATDAAGNTAFATVSGINIDKTAPTISGSASPAPNSNGWNNTNVTVSFSCSDAGSGIASCGPNQTLSGEGAGQSAGGAATDAAGNTAFATVSGINIDKTAPTISGSASPAPNSNGWNNTDVTVSFSCSDAGSGIASCGPNQTLSGEGAGQSATGTAVDNAGNTASATVNGINIDKTAPVVTVTGVSNGVTYTLGSVPAAGCSTTDALSGVATNASVQVSGGVVSTFTATCSGASDNAGNLAGNVNVSYTVIYNFNGFFSPIDNLPTVNVVKAGSAVPVKFSLNGNYGLNILAGTPTVQMVACGTNFATDQIEETVTAGSSSLSYDPITDQYIYVWKTQKGWNGCRELIVKLNDGTEHRARFQFNK